MPNRARTVALLLFGSGFSALVYQVVWLRELRLVFGASTPASAAVLAIFLGGLGFGGLVLGRRADRSENALRFYAALEIAIACFSAISPSLLWLVGKIYALTGGSPSIGIGAATVARLLLSAIVLGLPTFMMGGTLPAASRAATTEEDRRRRSVALLYGANTLGGVLGVLVATFLLLEAIGVRGTLWVACALNGAIGLLALRLARSLSSEPVRPVAEEGSAHARGEHRGSSARFVLAAAGVVGFAFLVMELVWYRMLGPLLGGTTYTFGLILAFVLLGIGAGGALYAAMGVRRAPSLETFALTCALEAAWIALPLALGDRIALFALRLQPLGAESFVSRALVWSAITSAVVLPTAVVSGYQFPLLIALLGEGRKKIGRQIGLAYAWNTVGAIAGSLAGGFVLMEMLTAPETWRLAVLLLLALAAVALTLAPRAERRFGRRLVPALVWVIALVLLLGPGPTAAWRHSPIGAGRVRVGDARENGLRNWLHAARRGIVWEAEGRESSVALKTTSGLSFLINGKSDGNARLDAPTQVMYGMVGGILHPEPKRALVIGLGTGSTAGWLASIPAMERVDVAEIEPAILDVARACSPVNRGAMESPKVRVFVGDAREIVLVAREPYDLIASEPSNPYRAGIASLFTREFYRAVSSRLNVEGLFLQWVQAYEVDGETIRTILATLASVFPYVETWQTNVTDLLLVCSGSPIEYDVPALRRRLAEEPYASALALAWRADGLEGFLSRFVSSRAFAKPASGEESSLVNTDDRPIVEFGFARTVGQGGLYRIEELRRGALGGSARRPERVNGRVDWERVGADRFGMYLLHGSRPPAHETGDDGPAGLAEAYGLYAEGDYRGARAAWPSGERDSLGILECTVRAHLLAEAGSEEAIGWIERVRAVHPADAEILGAILSWRRGEGGESSEALADAFDLCRRDPWAWPHLVERGLQIAVELAEGDTASARVLFGALADPFSVHVLDQKRLTALVQIGRALGPMPLAEAIARWEPHVPWEKAFLVERADAYRRAGHPLAERAERDLSEFTAAEPRSGS